MSDRVYRVVDFPAKSFPASVKESDAVPHKRGADGVDASAVPLKLQRKIEKGHLELKEHSKVVAPTMHKNAYVSKFLLPPKMAHKASSKAFAPFFVASAAPIESNDERGIVVEKVRKAPLIRENFVDATIPLNTPKKSQVRVRFEENTSTKSATETSGHKENVPVVPTNQVQNTAAKWREIKRLPQRARSNALKHSATVNTVSVEEANTDGDKEHRQRRSERIKSMAKDRKSGSSIPAKRPR